VSSSFSIAFAGLASCLLAVVAAPKAQSQEMPEIVSVKKIWDQGPHNAFTDLIRFQDLPNPDARADAIASV